MFNSFQGFCRGFLYSPRMHFTNRDGNKPGRAFKSHFRVDHKQITHNQMTVIAWSPLTPFTQNAPCQSCGRAAFWLSEAAVNNSRAKVLQLKRHRFQRRKVRNAQTLKTQTRKYVLFLLCIRRALPLEAWSTSVVQFIHVFGYVECIYCAFPKCCACVVKLMRKFSYVPVFCLLACVFLSCSSANVLI